MNITLFSYLVVIHRNNKNHTPAAGFLPAELLITIDLLIDNLTFQQYEWRTN